MNIKILIENKKQQFTDDGYLQFTKDEIQNLNVTEINEIKKEFKGYGIFKLPQDEIDFFEWLKQNDEDVWNDLWDTDDIPYLISVEFLNQIVEEDNGFPICDLEQEENYWFSVKHIKPKGKQKFDEINHKLNTNKKLNIEELLLFEIVKNSIDIWHFAYKYNIDLRKAKELVNLMHRDDILVHLTDREDLVKYIDF